jgi:hypothetical protein
MGRRQFPTAREPLRVYRHVGVLRKTMRVRGSYTKGPLMQAMSLR